MIESIINQIAERVPPSSGANLLGFTQDLDYALWTVKGILNPYKLSTTNTPRRLITVKAQIMDSVNDLGNVLEALEKVWSSVMYRNFEASSYHYYQEAAVFRFVTVMRNETLFVSGAIVLEGEKYHRLSSELQHNFKEIYDLLPSLGSLED